MKITKIIIGILAITSTSISCNNNNKADGYGNFEAVEITVSAENNGKLTVFSIEEGKTISKGEIVGVIDTIVIALKKEQLLISKNIISSKSSGVLSQISVLKAQLKSAKITQIRIQKMVKENMKAIYVGLGKNGILLMLSFNYILSLLAILVVSFFLSLFYLSLCVCLC